MTRRNTAQSMNCFESCGCLLLLLAATAFITLPIFINL